MPPFPQAGKKYLGKKPGCRIYYITYKHVHKRIDIYMYIFHFRRTRFLTPYRFSRVPHTHIVIHIQAHASLVFE